MTTEAIREVLENMDTWQLVGVWNEYCSDTYSDDYRIEPMSDFDDYVYGWSVREALEKNRF